MSILDKIINDNWELYANTITKVPKMMSLLKRFSEISVNDKNTHEVIELQEEVILLFYELNK